MIFTDVTLMGGRVHSRRRWDSRELEPHAVEVCGQLLGRIAGTGGRVEHGQKGLPPFWVALGLPSPFPEALGNDLFFCVGQRNGGAFQFNALLHADTDEGRAITALVTALGLSYGGAIPAGVAAASLEETVTPLYDERPLLATALLPLASLDPKVVTVAADFATCFAAAWLHAGP